MPFLSRRTSSTCIMTDLHKLKWFRILWLVALIPCGASEFARSDAVGTKAAARPWSSIATEVSTKYPILLKALFEARILAPYTADLHNTMQLSFTWSTCQIVAFWARQVQLWESNICTLTRIPVKNTCAKLVVCEETNLEGASISCATCQYKRRSWCFIGGKGAIWIEECQHGPVGAITLQKISFPRSLQLVIGCEAQVAVEKVQWYKYWFERTKIRNR